jgi:glycerol-3-phosphate dehydrogenase
MKKLLNVGVIGGGSFGTALATVAARAGNNVKILTHQEQTIKEINNSHRNPKYFPKEIELPLNITASNNIEEVLNDCNMIIHAIPVQVSYDFIHKNSKYIPKDVPYLIASKGMLIKQKKFFSEIWKDLFPDKNVPHCVISGPSFAIEIMKNFNTIVTIACKDKEIAKFCQRHLWYDTFRTYTTDDVVGVEIGGALKNPLAIAAGIVEGHSLGYNTLTSLVTRGIYEISLFSEKFGGRQDTLFGLAGIGDVMLTCLGTLSRNKAVGIKLAQGMKLEDILKNSNEVAEGIPTLLALGEIIKEHNLNMPIMKMLYRIVMGEVEIKDAGRLLFLRQLEDEFELKI